MLRQAAWASLIAVILASVLAAGCGLADPPVLEGSAKGDRLVSISVTSKAFAHDQWIPKKYTGEGADVSPPLEWSGVPDGTQELALICDDPDAPVAEPWVHWVIYKLPADTRGLPEGVPPSAKLDQPAGALQGQNSWPDGQTIGYRGPMPPPGHGVHHYHFTVYALREKLDLAPGAEKKALLRAMEGKVLGTGRLTGLYKR